MTSWQTPNTIALHVVLFLCDQPYVHATALIKAVRLETLCLKYHSGIGALVLTNLN